MIFMIICQGIGRMKHMTLNEDKNGCFDYFSYSDLSNLVFERLMIAKKLKKKPKSHIVAYFFYIKKNTFSFV